MIIRRGVKAVYWDRRRGEIVVRQRIFTLTDHGEPTASKMVETRVKAPKWGPRGVDRAELERAMKEAEALHESRLREMEEK